MAARQLTSAANRLCAILENHGPALTTDADLLRRYLQHQDEAAFAALVRRHGPMVLGVCRRVLHNLHDAEDAFQATFLVLVRRASSLRSPAVLGSWLYGVAYRTALHARDAAVKRRAKEAEMRARIQSRADTALDPQSSLDQELDRLPDKYRAVILLCDLEGMTRREAARRLSWAEGTVASRLARGRQLLAKRLVRQGICVSGTALAAALSHLAASACVPASLVAATAKAAMLFAAGRVVAAGAIPSNVLVLTKGVMQTMLVTKLKSASAVVLLALVVGLVGVGMGGHGLLYQGQAAAQAEESDPDRQKAKDDSRSPETPLEESLTKARVNGKYRMLLRQFKAEKDAETHGDFKDLGLRDEKEHAGQTDLPKGYWVYAKPYWYIWRDLSSDKRAKRAWGPEQATGEPDTNQAGDIPTAWASASQDDQDEWLMLEYDEPMTPTAIDVHETFNPGALYRITAFKLDGEEVELWKGDDPTPVGSDRGISSVPVKTKFKTNRIKLYIASKAVAGWNEIDAVGMHDKTGKIHWADSAEASSSYASTIATDLLTPSLLSDASIGRLQEEVQALKRQLAEMQKQMKQDREAHAQQQEQVLKSLDELKKLLQKEKN